MSRTTAAKRFFEKIRRPVTFSVSLLLTAVVSAYLGYAVPHWLADQKVILYERGFTNMTLPPNLRYAAKGSPYPYFYSSELRLQNVGDVDLDNEDVAVILAQSSLDCGFMKPAERRVKAFEVSGQKAFDADFDNFIINDDNQRLTIHLASLKRGEAKTFLLFSNYAFRTALKLTDPELSIRTVVPKRPNQSFEDDPWKLTNCEMIGEELRKRNLSPYKSMDPTP